jgi:hypothetical protein
VDQLDQRAPTMVEILLWAHSILSLALHVITICVNLGAIWVSLLSHRAMHGWRRTVRRPGDVQTRRHGLTTLG